MQIPQQCPICNTKDFLQYVFVQHFSDDTEVPVSTNNPSDTHYVYMCENLHVFDNNSTPIKEHNPIS